MTYTVDAYGVRFTIDMTGAGEYEPRVENMDDPTGDWDCSPPVDSEDELDVDLLMAELIKLSKLHEANACSWTLREKNLRALRARLMTLHDDPAEQ